MDLSKKDTALLKALAIFLIAMHNFLHLVWPKYPCNEFAFDREHFNFIITAFSFSESLKIFFSFAGYIGIYVFFFLSGYGLTKKMEQSPQPSKTYAIKRIIKLEQLLLVGCLFYIILSWDDVNYSHLLYKLTLTDNFSLSRIENISKPWWFLSCLAQLYVIFYPLYFFIKKKKTNIWMVLFFYVVVAYAFFILPIHSYYFTFNFIGHIPEFSLGIAAALYAENIDIKPKGYWKILFLSFIVFMAAQYWSWLWIYNGTAALLFILAFYMLIKKTSYSPVLCYIGKISPYIFIINGLSFRPLFIEIALSYSSIVQVAVGLLWFVLVCVMAGYIDWIISYCPKLHLAKQREK